MRSLVKSPHVGTSDPDNDWLSDYTSLLLEPGVSPAVAPAAASHAPVFLPGDDGSDSYLAAASAGSSGGGSGGAAGTTTTSTQLAGTTSTTVSPFVINISWDSSVGSAPSGFKDAVLKAASYLESQFVDPITINISVGYGNVGPYAMSGSMLGGATSYLKSYSYSTLLSALKADQTTTADAAAVATLPSASPYNGTYWVTSPQAKALGLTSGTSTAIDGYVGFSSTYTFDLDNSDGVTGGTYDLFGTAVHELTHAMGRWQFVGSTMLGTPNSYSIYDLFDYAAPGVRASAGAPGYFSIDSGVTNLGNFDTSGADPSDWGSGMGYDACNAYATSGVVKVVSESDLTAVDVVGYNRATGTPIDPPPIDPPPPPVPPSGVVIAFVTDSLASVGTNAGLAGSASLGRFTQTGGPSGDSYSYTLGGTGAGAFDLTSSGNVGTLKAGSAGVDGASGGTLYQLTVTASDITTGLSSPASPLNVIVAGSGDDTVSVRALSDTIGTSSPTFIYGLDGNDVLDGSGMSGEQWFAGGRGADRMIAGGGVDHFVYGATSDSSRAGWDVIAGFNTADIIDLSGVPGSLNYVARVNKSGLAAHSYTWSSDG
ncbi:MAG: NF038122 family metalloprotease, partial [Proteobacteria bacterium]|nr:NF038122 family metalloprotease [Pseudomonadota bacterium]